MATIVDSYSEANRNTYFAATGQFYSVAQSFTGNGKYLSSVKLHVAKVGTPGFGGMAYLYVTVMAHSGTYGTSSVPGSQLADSYTIIQAAGYTTSFVLYEYYFTGSNTIKLESGTNYVVQAMAIGSFNAANCYRIGIDSTSPSHGGNYSASTGGAFSADNTKDVCFYVYSDSMIKTIDGLAKASVKTVYGLANASVKTRNGLE